ncbi:MAG: adenylate kinase [Ruminococcaceae bacterium]|nr:adenylate kinase [Oscillospiraceae bacterium]
MKLILLGAPGAGKGTQAEFICDRYNIPALSTGNILREAVKNGTETGKKAKAYMDAGDLVPDDVIIGVIKERMEEPDAQNGFILDGVPRTLAQAEALERMGVDIDLALDIEVSDQAIIERLSGRRVCEKCGASYHTVFKPPRVPEVCDRCGGRLIIRKDDEPETILSRLKTYHEQTEPLIAFYKDRGKLAEIEGTESVEDTTKKVFKVLEALA